MFYLDDDPDWEVNNKMESGTCPFCGRDECDGNCWRGTGNQSYEKVIKRKETIEKMKEEKETVNHPQHYNRKNSMECIEEMILVFGKEAVKHFCLCNAWKYRYRAADKNGKEDIAKSDWYMNKYKELCEENKPTITISRPDVITVPYINNNVKTTPATVPSSVCIDYNKPTTSTSYTTTATVNI